MQKLLLLLAIISCSQTSFSQLPNLAIKDRDSNKVQLQKLDIQVKVIGNIAITTMEMEFCNTSNRILEGELTFPLPEGVNINRFALDMNGFMREAVPIEKEKGQVVFENTIRKKVDPALLEKVEGNNFKTRIYPLPANGCRRVLIGYQEILKTFTKKESGNLSRYILPLQGKNTIPEFNFSIKVYGNIEPEIGSSCKANIKFEKLPNLYQAAFTEKNYTPQSNFEFQFPQFVETEDIVLQQKNNNYYFLVNYTPKIEEEKATNLPNEIHLIWDNSFSQQFADHTKEIELVKAYMQKINNGTIHLSTISFFYNDVKTFTISNGSNEDLLTTLKNTTYDGATNFSLLQYTKAKNCLLITDGLNTYSNYWNTLPKGVVVHTATANASANFDKLRDVATNTGGQFINLNNTNATTAITLLSKKPFRLIKVEHDNSITEVYPPNTLVQGNTLITGMTNKPINELKLHYGYGNSVTKVVKIKIDSSIHLSNNIDLAKIWAQQKIESLTPQYEVYKETIKKLGKEFNIVTDGTSLIVLDDVADYIKYELPPPPDLKASYDSIMNAKIEIEKQKLASMLDRAKSMMKEIKEWHSTNFTPSVTFEILDYYTQNPLPSATVKVNGITFTSNEQGVVTINNIEHLNVIVSKTGYTPKQFKTNGSYNKHQDVYLLSVKRTTAARLANKTTKVYTVVEISNDPYGSKGVYKEVVAADEMQISTEESNLSPPTVVAVGLSVKREEKENLHYTTINKASDQLELQEAVKRMPGAQVDSSSYIWKTENSNSNTKPIEVDIKEISSNKTYIKELEATPDSLRYIKYLQLRKKYLTTPQFYFDVAKFFFRKGQKDLAFQILSTVADLNLNDYELYKMLGYELKKQQDYEQALFVFKKVLDWRPQEPQSYRDYALALEDVGLYQNAVDSIYECITHNYDTEMMSSYDGMEESLLFELNKMISTHTINTTKIDSSLITPLPVDVRVVLNWNSNDSDMDLWVTDPNKEKVYYSNSESKIGGRISNDFTSGYGPEQFILKNAKKGKYKVQLHYYGDSQQKIAGAATVMAEIYTNYGKPNQVRKIVTLQLAQEEEREGILVGEFEF